jgi:hypothetical protein
MYTEFIKHLLLILPVILAGGCNDSKDTQTDTETADTADAGQDTDTETQTDTKTEDKGTESDDVPDSGTAAAEVEIKNVFVYSDCMPSTDPDPIIAFWDVEITGGQGSSAVLSSAKVVIEGTVTVVQNLEIDVTEIPLVDGNGSASQRKSGADVNPPSLYICTDLCKGATYTLTLVFTVGDEHIESIVSGEFLCWY